MTCPNEYLISRNARDRYLRWRDDLKRAEQKTHEIKPASTSMANSRECPPCDYDTAPEPEPRRAFARDHTAAIVAGTWNEGQPDSPYTGTPLQQTQDEKAQSMENPTTPGYFRVVGTSAPVVKSSPLQATAEKLTPTSIPSFSRLQHHSRKSELGEQDNGSNGRETLSDANSKKDSHEKRHNHLTSRDGSTSPRVLKKSSRFTDTSQPASAGPRGVKRPVRPDEEGQHEYRDSRDKPRSEAVIEDLITDTIGAIAIDEKGQIAAGSSSGGIGMKHRGRLGPAALVGVGTAVVPCDQNDDDEISAASVTSGTGEHMATTMAAQRCAERIYHGTRRGRGGIDVKDDDENAIMESFIKEDFMDHPGVKNCYSAGAIGLMVVKQTQHGYYFYFAHNTDSFALALMGGADEQAQCIMSRLPKGAKVASGGRKVRLS